MNKFFKFLKDITPSKVAAYLLTLSILTISFTAIIALRQVDLDPDDIIKISAAFSFTVIFGMFLVLGFRRTSSFIDVDKLWRTSQHHVKAAELMEEKLNSMEQEVDLVKERSERNLQSLEELLKQDFRGYSCSLLFVFIEFLSAWFLKQYRHFVDTSTYLVKIKSIFDKYMLTYLFYKKDVKKSEAMSMRMLEILERDIKWPETYLLKKTDISFAKEAFESFSTFADAMKKEAGRVSGNHK